MSWGFNLLNMDGVVLEDEVRIKAGDPWFDIRMCITLSTKMFCVDYLIRSTLVFQSTHIIFNIEK